MGASTKRVGLFSIFLLFIFVLSFWLSKNVETQTEMDQDLMRRLQVADAAGDVLTVEQHFQNLQKSLRRTAKELKMLQNSITDKNVQGLRQLPDAFDLGAACPTITKHSQYKGEFESWLFSTWFAEQPKKLFGTYIEIGAFDGWNYSNTWYVEYCLGWSGLLIEGGPSLVQKCRKNRGEQCIHMAVCPNGEGTIPFYESGAMGGTAPKAVRDTAKTVEVPCKPFKDILADYNIGAIDLWSLDMEDAEMLALESYDWQKNPVHLIFMENSKSGDQEEREKLLTRNCMKKVEKKFRDNTAWWNPRFPLPACP